MDFMTCTGYSNFAWSKGFDEWGGPQAHKEQDKTGAKSHEEHQILILKEYV
jgi:hypothetical protein